jgi:hypothetical protein
MSDYKEVLTEEEQYEAGRAMLGAALDAFGDFPSNADDESQDEMAQRVVFALAATRKAEYAERKRLEAIKGERLFWLGTEAEQATATAFWMWTEGIKLDSVKIWASSVMGTRYLALAQGLFAARHMSEALLMLEDGNVFFSGHGAEELSTFITIPWVTKK